MPAESVVRLRTLDGLRLARRPRRGVPAGTALKRPEVGRQRLGIRSGVRSGPLEAARDGQQPARGPVAGISHAADDARLPPGAPDDHRAEGPAVAVVAVGVKQQVKAAGPLGGIVRAWLPAGIRGRERHPD